MLISKAHRKSMILLSFCSNCANQTIQKEDTDLHCRSSKQITSMKQRKTHAPSTLLFRKKKKKKKRKKKSQLKRHKRQRTKELGTTNNKSS